MANTQTVKDRLDEALTKSLILFFEADLVTAWGSDVECVAGSPDFDYENRALASGGTEPRDLSAKPLLVLFPLGGFSGPFCIDGGPDDLTFRSTRFRLNLAAGGHFDILSLKGTVEAVMDGAKDGTGGIDVVDPDTLAPLGVTVYFDDDIQLSNVFGGPGDSGEGAETAEGKGQFGTLKHRASLVFGIDVRKPRGSAVL